MDQQGRLWFGSYDGLLYALDQKDGRPCFDPYPLEGSAFASPIVWKEDEVEESSTSTSAAIKRSHIVVCTTRGTVWSLLAEQGKAVLEVHWRMTFPTPIFTTPAILHSHNTSRPPVVVIATADGSIRGLALTGDTQGQVLWQHHAQAPIFSSPRLHPITSTTTSLLVCVGSQDGRVRCLDGMKGTVVWEVDIGSGAVFSTAWVCSSHSGGTVVVVTTLGGLVVIMDGDNGRELGRASVGRGGEVFSSAVVVDGKVVVGCRDDNVYTWRMKTKQDEG